MNQLFERFITGFIQRHRNEVLPSNLKDCELLPQGLRATKYLANLGGQRVFRLKPDLVFRVDDQFPVLMDLKYKHLDEGDRKLGVAESDFYQMVAYANRYNCSRVILLYPQTAELSAPQRANFKLEGSPQEVWAVTVNLLQDLSEPGCRQALQTELRNLLEGVDG